MTPYTVIFYLLAALIVVSTGIAITRRNLVHVIIYLVFSFFGTAMLFYLFGAPFLAAMEIIVYAGAIMVLFLFIIMMLKVEKAEASILPLRQWIPAAALCGACGILGALVTVADTSADKTLEAAMAAPKIFGHYVIQNHWISIELVSVLLLVALVGALHLGQAVTSEETKEAS